MRIRSSHIFPLLICSILTAILSSGCSDPAQPDNLEPELVLIEATDITRFEAVISARVIEHGSGGLTRLSFHYGVEGNIDQTIPADDPSAEVVTCRLTGLRPGTTYSWYVEGGTSTATLRSETMTFTTIPNNRPSVSAPVALSTGPIGLIVSFDITDDGGEPVLEAGCEVTDMVTSSSRRLYLAPDDLTEGTHRINISGLNLETSYRITPFASNTSGESAGEALEYTTQNSIVLEEAGALPKIFDGITDITLGHLTISGNMNGDDFRWLRPVLGAPALPGEVQIKSSVTSVDLTDAVITEGGDTYDGRRFTTAGELSTGLFSDCVQLRTIALPATAVIMDHDAFARCTSLEELTIPAGVHTILPSADCPALRAIEVSPANESYLSNDGVLFNLAGTEILWFPLGKTGSFHLPSTITSIGESAFAGTSITGLEIPPSVTVISRGAFAGSQIAEITLPDNITNISEGMFQLCSTLTTLHLGSATEFVGNYFIDGTNLTDLYVTAPIPPYAATEAFVNRTLPISDNCILHVHKGSKTIYRNHSQWSRFKKIVEITE